MTPRIARTPVGLIGIGAMGLAMARNLHQRGYAVSVRDIRDDAVALAREEGMTICADARAVIETCSVAAVVVRDAAEIDQVLGGDRGLLAATARGATVVLCSTIAPEESQRIGSVLEACGIHTVDGPISGGPARARDGSMSMMLAGSDSVLAPLEPLFADLAARRFRVGHTLGDAAKAKLVNNLLAGINLVAAAEAFALAHRVGLDPAMMFELISASSGSSWVFQDRMPRVLNDDFRARAAATILTKDVRLALELAARVGLDAPLGRAALERFRLTVAGGWADLDDAAVFKTYLG